MNSYSANFPFILILHVVIVIFCIFHDLFLSLQLNGNYSYSDTPLKPFRTEKLSLYTLIVLHVFITIEQPKLIRNIRV